MRSFLLPFRHPIIFSMPRRLAPSGWIQHVPFAFFLVDVLRPTLIVELGSFAGVSYCAFCQAVGTLNIQTKCFAVDTWQGDPHAGIYGQEILDGLKSHHDPRYAGFSTLLQCTFDDAVGQFQDHSIDLLNIDGYHTYDAVKHDFQSWLPKMSDNGIILFHDISVRGRDFGAWKLWDEVKTKYPSFDFSHGSGLGVLYVGKHTPQWLDTLSKAPNWERLFLRTFFSVLGKWIDAIKTIKVSIT